MHIEQLKYIVEVQKTGSMSRAAQNMHVTLSGISQAIAHLEEEWGIALFSRSRLGATPTPEGAEMIRQAADILNQLSALTETAQQYNHSLSGRLRIATIPGPMALLVNVVSRFRMEYPNIRVDMVEAGSQTILDSVLDNTVDIGLVVLSDQITIRNKELTFERVLPGRMMVGASREAPIGEPAFVTPEELKNHSVVLYNDDYMRWFLEEFEHRHGPLDVLFTTNNTDAIRRAMVQYSAITIGPSYTFSKEWTASTDFVTMELRDDRAYPVDLGWIRSEAKPFSPIAKYFMTHLQHELARYLG